MIHGRNGDGVQDGLCRLRSITESSGTLRFRENATGLNVARATSEAMRDAPAALFSFGCTLAESGPMEPDPCSTRVTTTKPNKSQNIGISTK